jgi:hypothetical protein
MGAELSSGFDCRVCGLHHAVLPLSFSVKYPLAVGAVPKDEMDRRVVITPDLCVIDERFHYVRGRFAIPIHGLEEPFIWGCWVKIAPQDFFKTHQMWSDPARVDEPPFEGVLNSELPLYGDTRNLPVKVVSMPVGRRPHFFPVAEDHPIAVEIRDGISMERVVEIAESMLHKGN